MNFYSHIKKDKMTNKIIDKKELNVHLKNVAELMKNEIFRSWILSTKLKKIFF